ncbi:methyl-accepting chemotaxis protein [Evansella sp. AB-rgal1]|uniref:methyl-accepting chemotaxis protein n=1 Tax=Evansella sp. AB-rgal1 TaxID=3242696 RepID=UPI00359DCBCC
MEQRKNLLMLCFTGFVALLSIIIYFLHHQFHFLDEVIQTSHHAHFTESSITPILFYIFFSIPILLLLLALLIYTKNKEHPYLPPVLMLGLTFGSISIIAVGDGLVEYHFSIFMVLAALAFFQSIRLIVASTIIFAVQHVGGYFLAPELIAGTSEYSFVLLMIHAVFLLITSAVIIVQIAAQTSYRSEVEIRETSQRSVLKDIIDHLSTTSKEVLISANHLEQGSKESAAATGEISEAIQTIAQGAYDQLHHAKSSHQAMEEVSQDMISISKQSNETKESSMHTLAVAQTGQTSMNNTEDQMVSISKAVEQMNDVIKHLQERSSEIEQTLVYMSDIAEQTNLLALNAAIEAARAGESGRGFAIVADEVRKLADQSSKYANQVSHIIKDLLVDTKEADGVMQETNKQVELGLDQVSMTRQLFEKIVQDSKKVYEDVNNTYEKSQSIVGKVDAVKHSINSMTTVSQDYQKSTENISASSEQQLAMLENFNETTTSLKNMMERLDQLVQDISKKD